MAGRSSLGEKELEDGRRIKKAAKIHPMNPAASIDIACWFATILQTLTSQA